MQDQFGDELPRGAIARLGTSRWHSDACRRVAFVGAGESLITAGFDGAVHQWEVPTGRQIRTFGTDLGPIWGINVSADNRLLAVGLKRNEVLVWEIKSGKLLWKSTEEEVFGAVPEVAFSPDSRLLAVIKPRHSVAVFQAESGRNVQTLELDDDHFFRALCWSPDGKWIACGSIEGLACAVDVASGKVIQELKHPETDEVRAIRFSRDGSSLVTVSGLPEELQSPETKHDPSLRVWDAATGRVRHVIRAHGVEIEGLALSNDGGTLAFSDKHTARIIQFLEDGTLHEKPTLKATSWVTALEFLRDGRYLAAGSLPQCRKWPEPSINQRRSL